MSVNISEIKTRIKSIDSTKKITNAMELVSTAKLSKIKNNMLRNREYVNELSNITSLLMNASNGSTFKLNESTDKKLYVVFCSDMGLCGAFNQNIYKLIAEKVSKNDQIILLGNKLRNDLKKDGYNVTNKLQNSEEVDINLLSQISNYLLDKYLNHEIDYIGVIYTKFKNEFTNYVCLEDLFTVDNKDDKQYEVLFEPNAESILNDLLPMMIKSSLYSKYLETKVSEYSARKMAMSNANDNADDLLEELHLKYNQARQASITQEITEIIGATNV